VFYDIYDVFYDIYDVLYDPYNVFYDPYYVYDVFYDIYHVIYVVYLKERLILGHASFANRRLRKSPQCVDIKIKTCTDSNAIDSSLKIYTITVNRTHFTVSSLL